MRSTPALLAALTLAATLACAPAPPPPPDPGIVNSALAVRLAEVPEGFTVTLNEGARLELGPTAPEVDGTITFHIGPEETNINLIAAMKAHQRRIERRDGSSYKGGQELAGPLGTAFYSRGRYQDGEAALEETAVFTIHPDGRHLLEIRYVYPAGADAATRVSQLLGVLARVEPVPPEGVSE